MQKGNKSYIRFTFSEVTFFFIFVLNLCFLIDKKEKSQYDPG